MAALKGKPKQKRPPLAETKEFQKFKLSLEEAKRILISTHQLPDGDGLGAESALYHYLKRARKSCRVYNPDTIPRRYQFLDPKEQVLLGPNQVELWDTFDLWVIVDTNDPRRMGKLWNELNLRARKIVFLDHHPTPLGDHAITYPPHAWVVSDHESSSIAELLYHLFEELKLTEINEEIALGLYVSVMTDTNSFRYARTTPLAHRMAASTIEKGVNPEEVYQNIYSSKELSHVQLMGHLLTSTKVSPNGKLAWMELPLDLRSKFKASADDTQSFLNLLLLLKTAEVVALFREEEDGTTRVSIKSKGKVIVNRIAHELGGGGHEYAAGAALRQSLASTVTLVTQKIEAGIANHDFSNKSQK